MAALSVLAIPAVLGAAGTAGYTAFLFGQCEGRDLWQTPLLLPILLAQAVTAGGRRPACLADLFVDVPDPRAVRWVLLGGVLATAALVAIELTSHGSRHVELAMHDHDPRRLRRQFWVGRRARRAGHSGCARRRCCWWPTTNPAVLAAGRACAPWSACSPTKTRSSWRPVSRSRSHEQTEDIAP